MGLLPKKSHFVAECACILSPDNARASTRHLLCIISDFRIKFCDSKC